MALVTKEYEALVVELNRLGLQESNKVMKGGKFTGWLWDAAGLVKTEREEREKEKGRGEEREEEREEDRGSYYTSFT